MEISEKKAVELLRKYAPDEKTFRIVLAHSKKGQEIALKIAKNIPEADNEFIKIAMLLHDIGRFKCPPRTKNSIRHGIEGAKILRKENFFKYARVAERHLGVGITKEDIKKQKLDLPLKDYIPESIEEKIIAHADNLLFGDKEGTIQQVIERYTKEISKEYGERIKKFHNELEKLKGKNFI